MNSSSSTFFWVPATTKSYKDLFLHSLAPFTLLHPSCTCPSYLEPSDKLIFMVLYLFIFCLCLSLLPSLLLSLPLSLPPVKKQLNPDRPLLHLELVFKVPGRRKMQSDHLTAGFVWLCLLRRIPLGLSQMTSFLMGFEGRKCKVDCFTDTSSANLF